MIAYRYCSNEEIEELKKDKIKGYKYKTNNLINTHEYEKNKRYLHFYLDEDSVFSYDDVEPNGLLEFIFPNEFDEYRGIGYYYCVNDSGEMQIRKVNQLAVPASLVKREYVKNSQPIQEEEYESNIKRLVKHGL